ncbi:MAG: hypothetical protein IJ156_07000 [Bacteroidales bacterium]|nr:hypothetical protein [Bacteroidales bacterium]
MKKGNVCLWAMLALAASLVIGCEKQPEPTPTPPEKKELTPTSGDLNPSDVPNYDKIYMCSEFYKSERGWTVTQTFYDPLKPESLYYFGRSKQSEHFILFWDKDYKDKSPDDSAAPYHLDTDAFLAWCEEIYAYYVNTLKFAHFTPAEKSYLDSYKFQIYLWHQTEWAAYGSGPDDNITGCLWVNPEAANSRSTVAHEIGHSFQYQTACDLVLNKKVNDIGTASFRYDQGQGSTFWEQTAQWQAFQMCPEETFTNYYFPVFCDNCHRHFAHEDMRYGSYFFHYYWVDKYGIDAVANVWRTARRPKDALESYMAAYGLGIDAFNAQVYDYAARIATWDFKQIRDAGARYAGSVSWKGVDDGAGWWKVDPAKAPEATGFNLIRLGVVSGQELTMDFAGMPNAAGYNNSGDASQAGWTIGFVSLGNDMTTRTYSESTMATAATNNYATLKWTVPAGTKAVWAVVACTPTTYITHLWDENNSNDRHWPYKVKFLADGEVLDLGAPQSGFLEGSGGTAHTYAWTMSGSTVSVDVDIDTDVAVSQGGFELGHFELPVAKVNAFIGADVRDLDENSFYGVNADGTKIPEFTSYKPGMWEDVSGKACAWGAGAAYWQWYIWGGKKDKSGSKIWYDGDPDGTGANQGRFVVGKNPDNVAAAKGKTITFRNKIAANGATYDFIVTYKYH